MIALFAENPKFQQIIQLTKFVLKFPLELKIQKGVHNTPKIQLLCSQKHSKPYSKRLKLFQVKSNFQTINHTQ